MTPGERLSRKNEFDGELSSGVRQFNLSTGRDRHLKRINKLNTELIDPETELVREDLTVSRPCPVCDSDEARLIFIKDGFSHLKCSVCGMVYVSPVLKEKNLHFFYQDEDSYMRVLANESQLAMDEIKFQYGLDLIEEYVPLKGNLLDIGCGPGIFLNLARERNWHVQGIEFNSWCVQHLKELSIGVIDVPIKEAMLPQGFYNCVTMWTVLEHIVKPGDLLTEIHRILAPDGIILILVPNVDSLANRILHEKSTTFSGKTHVNLFNATSLSRLLEKKGFAVTESETILTRLGAINNYLNYEDPQFGEGNSVLGCLTPKYIHENMLGYLLLVLAKVSHK